MTRPRPIGLVGRKEEWQAPAATDVLIDDTTNDLTTAPVATGATGWKYYTLLGRVITNDNTTLVDGINTEDLLKAGVDKRAVAVDGC